MALAGALPSLPVLDLLYFDSCSGMGPDGAAALAAALPQCPRLRRLWVQACGLPFQAQAALRAQQREATADRHALTILT